VSDFKIGLFFQAKEKEAISAALTANQYLHNDMLAPLLVKAGPLPKLIVVCLPFG
jgi:hypothetical protein